MTTRPTRSLSFLQSALSKALAEPDVPPIDYIEQRPRGIDKGALTEQEREWLEEARIRGEFDEQL